MDTPHLDWPASKNVLAVKTYAPFEIAQGRCRDFVLTGTNAPDGCQWDILLYEEVVARSCQPSGWSVEADHSVYGGFNVCVPADAATAKRYEVRVRDAFDANYSGYFEILASGMQNTAPVLLPLALAPQNAGTNSLVTLTIALDAPAQGDGAYVSLTTSNLPAGLIPSHVHIPAGQSSTTLAFKAATNNLDYAIVASHNGQRFINGSVIASADTSSPVQNVLALAETGRIVLSWDAYPGALYYRVEDQLLAVPLVDEYVGTCLVITNADVDTFHCFDVYAVTPSGVSPYGGDCAWTVDGVLRPRITPHGGRFNDVAAVTITCETTNASIYWSTNGILPSLTNGTNYTGPISLKHSAQVIARAYVSGVWSIDDRADFHISQPQLISCGDTNNSMLAATNQPSAVKGDGFYASRYSFEGRRGDVVTITVLSQDFDSDLSLKDPNGVVVAQNDIALSIGLGIRPAIVHTLRTNGAYVFEVTSARQFITGHYSVKLACTSSPELDVFFGTTNVTNNAAFDLGLKTNGGTAQLTLRITNSGSATLTFSSVSIAPSSLFSINPSTFTSLATNSGTNLTVTFNALSNGLWTGSLTLINNDDFDDVTDGYEAEDQFVLTFSAFVNPPGVPPTVTITNLSNGQVGQVLTTPPTLTVGATTTVTNTASVTQVVFRATGPNGTISLGAVTASPWRVNWNNAAGGNYTLQAVVLDSAGRMGLSAPTNIIVNNWPVAVNDAITVSMNSTNALNVLANDSDPNNNPIMVTNVVTNPSKGTANLANGVLTYIPSNNVFGRDSLQYAIADIYGARATGTVSLLIRPSGSFYVALYTNAVQITSPSNHVEILGPTNILGTARSDFLDYWKLEYRRRSGGPSVWTLLSTATTNVSNGFLGVFDPTGLPNGQYDLRVTVFDLFGANLDNDATVLVTENQKIGHFTLSFTDLQIPVSGLPITLTRTYDSRNTESGDFGAGWNLDVSSVRLEKSGLMGEGWGKATYFVNQCVEETEAHVVTVTFPDDKVYRFTPWVDLNDQGSPCTVIGGLGLGAKANIYYRSLPGTVGTLRELHPSASLDVTIVDDADVFFLEDRDNPTETSVLGPLYDPTEFEFTTLDGRKFQFNAAGKVVKMIDRVGNSLTFSSDGVIHSSGKSVKFVRDAAGRITEIYDPNGLNSSSQPNGPPAIQFKYSGANLVSVQRLTDRNATNPAYVVTQFGYENSKYPHYLTRIDDPRGHVGIRNEFGDDGRLKSMTDASGKSITYLHDLNGKTEIVVDRLGNTNVFKYDAKGNVTNSVNALGQVNSYTFDANNNKTGEVIAGLLTNSFVYDANNLLTESVVGGLITNRFTYNKFGQVLAALDGLGRGATNFYDALGNLIVTTNALGFTNGFSYDLAGNLTAVRDSVGILTTNWFDEFGNLTNSVVGNLAASAYTYDANGNPLTETQWRQAGYENVEALATNTFTYDAQNRVIATIDSFGKTNRTIYNELGKQEQITDKLGRITRYHYDLRGYLTNVTYPDNTFEQYAFDAEGRRTNSVDRAGRVTGFVFDALGRLTQTIYPDNTSTRTIFDELGRVKFTVDARGATNAFGYDAAGRRIAATNAWGTAVAQWSTNGYDSAGNLIAASDALGRVTDFIYNAANQPVQVIYPAIASGQSRPFTLTGYDGEGRPSVGTNEASVVTGFRYHTALGSLLSVTNAQGTADKIITSYSYDPRGRQTNQVDAMGRRTGFEFDAEGRRSRRLLPGAQSEGFTYDAAGNVLRHTNFNGQVITNLYDSQNRLLSRWHGSTQLVAFAYNAIGLRTSMSNEAGVTTFVYDKRDRLITNATPVGTLIYAYDENGNLTNMVSSTSGGVSIGYQYDALNRLTNVIDNRLTGTRNTTYTFDPAGNLVALKYPNGVTNLWQYDARNRLTNLIWKLNSTIHGSFAYLLGVAGNRTNLSETVNGNSRTFAWSYDSLYRLTNETVSGTAPTGTIGYRLDAVGNRTNRTSGVTGILATNNYFDANDWLDIDSTTNNGNAWFDANGNTRTNLGGTVTNLLYDWGNRLTNANNGAVLITYDADGNRTKKVAGSVTTLYLVGTINPSGYSQVIEEFTVNAGVTNLSRIYTHGLDLISQRDPNSSTNFFGTDGLGSTRLLMNMAGSVANALAYDAFGSLIASNGPLQTEYLFTGEQRDGDLGGLYYLRARYNNPNTGRFLTADTFEGWLHTPSSLQRYLYGGGNPVNRIDPSGNVELSINAQLTVVAVALIATTIYYAPQYAPGPVLGPRYYRPQVRIRPGSDPAPIPKPKPRGGDFPPVPPYPPDDEGSSANRMRLQLQDNAQGEDTYWTTVLENRRQVGVTVLQVREGMEMMWEEVDAGLTDKEFPEHLAHQLRSAIIRVSQKLDSVRTGGGVTEIGNVRGLQETFYDRGVQYRLDVENLSGHNLRR